MKVYAKTKVMCFYLVFVFINFFVFSRDRNLFSDYDGNYYLSEISNQRVWKDSNFLNAGVNQLQGIGGNIRFPYNASLDPGAWIVSSFPSNGIVYAHVFYSLVIGISIHALGSILKCRKTSILLSVFLLPALTLWPISIRLYPIAAMVPAWAILIAITNFVIALYFMFLRARWQKSYLYAAMAGLLILYGVMLFPVTFPISGIAILIFVSSGLIFFRKIMKTFLFCLAICLILFGSRAAEYVYGLLVYNYAVMFGGELEGFRGTKSGVSSIFWAPFPTNVYPYVIIAFLLTLIFGLMKSFEEIRASFAACLSYLLLAFMFSLYYLGNAKYSGPDPVYFETFFWSPLFLLIAHLVVTCLNPIFRLNRGAFLLLVGVVSLVMIVFPVRNYDPGESIRFDMKLEKSSDLNNLTLREGGEFKGRTHRVTFRDSISNSWLGSFSSDFEDKKLSGYEYRAMSMWNAQVPTLFEYSPLITPQFYLFSKKFLMLDTDQQMRNVVLNRRLNLDALKFLGVTRLLTESEITGLEPMTKISIGNEVIYDYRLENSNIQGTSPNTLVQTTSMEETFAILELNHFNPKIAVVHEKFLVENGIKVADWSALKVIKGGYQVESNSSGRSLVVLPVEFSNCWKIEKQKGDLSSVRLVRVDGILLGVSFENVIKMRILYVNGPIRNANCRIKDREEFNEMYASQQN